MTSGKFQCTASDVKIAFASNPRDASGNPITQCALSGTIPNLIADFTVVTTATSRQNIGLFMNTQDQAGGALNVGNTCTDNIISPIHNPGSNTGTEGSTCFTGAGQTPQCLGSALYLENDSQVNSKGVPTPDNCGDITTADNNQVVTVDVGAVKCEPAPGCDPTKQKCNLVLPNCTSWQQPGGAIECESGPDTANLTGWLYSTAAIPGTVSKCSCNSTFTVPIIVITPGLGVTKTANPTSISGTDGGTSTYTVVVTNQNSSGSDTVEQICDNRYGNIATASGFTGPACPAGSLCSSPNNVAGTTCATNISCSLPATLTSPGDSVTCTFSGFVPESSTVTDTATANAVVVATGAPVSGSGNATVTAGDAPAAAAFIKTLGSTSPTSGCATVIYDVEVDNTSGSTTDESETLNTFSDNVYGDITTVHGDAHTSGSVVSTTCAVPQSIAVGGNYTCSFDGVICSSSLGAIISPTACAAGTEVTDRLTGTLTGDETGQSVSVTPGSRTVEVCFSASSN